MNKSTGNEKMIETNHVYYLRSADKNLSELGECGGALTTFMKFLLEKKIVDGVLTVKKNKEIYDVVPVLITDYNKLNETAGSLHCGTSNIAKILVKYFDDFQDKKLAITVKPCETNTILELANLDKINLENIIMVGVNCGGTFPPVPTRNMIEEVFEVDADQVSNEEVDKGNFIIITEEGSKKEININNLEENRYGRRSNCRRCELNIPINADIGFGNWGVTEDYANDYSCVEVFTVRGAELLDKAITSGQIVIEKTSDDANKIRHKIDKSMVDLAKKWQFKHFKDSQNNDILSVFFMYQDEFQKCINCFGCRNACPICYCKECSLESNTPEWVDKGQLPPSPLFHLERLTHMVEYCTNCGQCEDVCPMDIPLATIWHQINLKIKELNYSPIIDNDQLILFDYSKLE